MYEEKGYGSCQYPNCEKCENYIMRGEYNYCDVPITMSKQDMKKFEGLIVRMDERIRDVEELVGDLL